MPMAPGLAGVSWGDRPALLNSCPKRWLPFARSNLIGNEIGDDGVINGVSSSHGKARVSTICANRLCYHK
jgi:hypothetical protein